MDIPKKIKEAASARGWHRVEYAGSSYGSLVFRKVVEGDEPVGLPQVLVLSGDEVVYIPGEQALSLLSFLDHP